MAIEKSMKPGGGGRFAEVKANAAKHGASDPAAVAAAAGRKKYGAEKMGEFATEGRARVAKGIPEAPEAKASKVHSMLQLHAGLSSAPALGGPAVGSHVIHTHPEYGSMTHGHEGGNTPHGHDFSGLAR